MKRSIVILIACTLLLPFCTACGDSAESSGGQHRSNRTEKQTTETAEETAADTPAHSTTAYKTAQETESPMTESPMTAYTVRAADWEDIQWTQYQCAYLTLMIPEDWQVEWNGNSEALVWQARAGDGSMLGLSNTDHLIAAKNAEICKL